MTDTIQTEPLAKIDYISVVDAKTMQPVQKVTAPVIVAIGSIYWFYDLLITSHMIQIKEEKVMNLYYSQQHSYQILDFS